MKNKKIYLAIILTVGLVIIGGVAAAVITVVTNSSTNHNGTKGLTDTPQNHQMINNDVVNFILENKWFENDKYDQAIDIGTIPNNSTTNTGVAYNKKSDTVNWTINILSNTTGSWKYYATIDLGNLINESDLIKKINTKSIWNNEKLFFESLPKISNTAANREMINNDVANFILKNVWYTKADHLTIIDIGTIPNNNSDNEGVSWVNTNGTAHWSVNILSNITGSWENYLNINLGNPSTETDLISKISDSNTWSENTGSANNKLYPYHLTTRIYVLTYLRTYFASFRIPNDPKNRNDNYWVYTHNSISRSVDFKDPTIYPNNKSFNSFNFIIKFTVWDIVTNKPISPVSGSNFILQFYNTNTDWSNISTMTTDKLNILIHQKYSGLNRPKLNRFKYY